MALDQSLRFLGHHKRVLMIAAHPDDEDTELLTLLARGMGVEAAYLSLTRGEGGQNLIGPELGPALGVLRTEELLAARTLDGARQFFTRAYDFGYSKNLADTWRFWPRDSVLKDVVRVIRRFQPQIIVSIFSGTPRDGHGQHQAAGWAAREGFAAAGDSSRFADLVREEKLSPWQPLKLYQSARFGGAEPTLTLEGGVLDRAVGQSFLQIAMRGRSLHRSQDMGSPQRIGPSPVRLRLLEDRTGQGSAGLFSGIDTSLAAAMGATGSEGRVADSIAAGLRSLTALDPSGLAPLRRRLLELLGPVSAWPPAARDQVRRLDHATRIASGVLCDAVASLDRVVPGSSLAVAVSCWNTTTDQIELTGELVVNGRPHGAALARPLPPGVLQTDTLSFRVPDDLTATEPYYLRSPLSGAMYRWPAGEPALWSEPFEPPPLMVRFATADWSMDREVQFRIIDQAIGEVRRPVFIVPRVDVQVDPSTGFWPRRTAHASSFTVRLRHQASDSTAGTVGLAGSPGWSVTPALPFQLIGVSDQNVLTFRVSTASASPSTVLTVSAKDGPGRSWSTGFVRVDYPHIRARQLTRPAEIRLSAAELQLPDGPIGYIRGAADRIPESLATLGVNLVLLPRDSLARGNLARFRTIVVGPRAYETEPALELNNGRLLEYVRGGGTLIVQYQQQAYFRGGYAPFGLSLTERLGETPVRVSAARVAEEDAAVTLLDQAHAVFNTPNRLDASDWSGWIQERGLYFARSWSPEWTPLLEMSDTGEPPQRGALLLSRSGRGLYVYTGISFFRQLPAAVPGAARLFMNLLALR